MLYNGIDLGTTLDYRFIFGTTPALAAPSDRRPRADRTNHGLSLLAGLRYHTGNRAPVNTVYVVVGAGYQLGFDRYRLKE